MSNRRDKHLFDDFTPENLEKRFGGKAEDLIYGENDSLFPPRVPCDNVFFPWEDKNKILISENEYINKCKNGEIPIESMSPFIQEKLIIEEQNKKKHKEEQNKNIIKNETKKYNILNTNINIYNPIKTSINNNNNFNLNNDIDIRKTKAYEINKFMRSSNWKLQEEFSNRNIFKSTKFNHFVNYYINNNML